MGETKAFATNKYNIIPCLCFGTYCFMCFYCVLCSFWFFCFLWALRGKSAFQL